MSYIFMKGLHFNGPPIKRKVSLWT